jgi:hypothetical protein
METLPRRTSPRLQPSEPADGLAALIAGVSSVLLTGRSRA